MASSTIAAQRKAAYIQAPFNTQQCVSSLDFQTTAATSYGKMSLHDMGVAKYVAERQRNLNQVQNYKIEAPYQVKLNEGEVKQKEKIKTMFAIRRRKAKKAKAATADASNAAQPTRKKVYPYERKPPVPKQAYRAL